MGTDIHIHVEYQSCRKGKKPQWIHSREKFTGDRIYAVFSVLAGVYDYIKPLYPPRGLPDDITLITYKDYKDWLGDAHTESWLTTKEFSECIVTFEKICRENNPDEYVDRILKNYHHILKYMKDSDDEGEPARIIFWFDN